MPKRKASKVATDADSRVNGSLREDAKAIATISSSSGVAESSKEASATKAQTKKTRAHQSKGQAEADETKENATVDPNAADPEAEIEEAADPEEIKSAAERPPPVNSDYLPLPWNGRLGYACLNTYLRYSNPPVFSSRTTRIASILEHRHPLQDPSKPENAIKNRPDRSKPAEVWRGQEFVQQLCLANVRDMVKMVRWNDKYNIKFFRLSSEAFPFASHEEYGYKLAPFASEALEAVGRVIAELGHRVSTHPGQFTQLGSPRNQVIQNAIRDLEYHDEMLSLLKLPYQQDKDAVMVLHMGGVFGDKVATLDRFRENYKKLSQSIKNRLVLENDDVSWSVHELLPVCQELNIPLVLDYHHNNIIFDSSKIREGTKDIMKYYDAIRATWTRKGITQKMHYSEPTPAAITGRQRRKHNPRVATLPPCAPDMDLMIEAKDKEQAVFELMRTFKLPGYDRMNSIIPHIRRDDNKEVDAVLKKLERQKASAAKTVPKKPKPELVVPDLIPDEEVGMGGPENRVYWPPGMEEWLRPEKRIVQKKEGPPATPAKRVVAKANGHADTTLEQTDETNIKAEEEAIGVTEPPEQRKGDTAVVESIPADIAKPPKKGRKPRSTAKPSPSITKFNDGVEVSNKGDALLPAETFPNGTSDAPQPVGRAAKRARVAIAPRTTGRTAARVSYAESDGSE